MMFTLSGNLSRAHPFDPLLIKYHKQHHETESKLSRREQTNLDYSAFNETLAKRVICYFKSEA